VRSSAQSYWLLYRYAIAAYVLRLAFGGANKAAAAFRFLSLFSQIHGRLHTLVGSRVPQTSGRQYNIMCDMFCADGRWRRRATMHIFWRA
jgi:hypothetical protein